MIRNNPGNAQVCPSLQVPMAAGHLVCTGTAIHRRFQTRASPGIARVKFWSIMLIDHHYILRDDRAEFSDGKSKARQLGGGVGFFSTYKPSARRACRLPG